MSEVIQFDANPLAKKEEWIADKEAALDNAALIQVVDTKERAECSVGVQNTIRKLIKDLEKERLAVTRPIDAFKKTITDQEKELVADLKAEQARIKSLNDAFATQQAAELERKRIAQAEEDCRRQQEEMQRQMQAEEAFGPGAVIAQDEPETREYIPEKVKFAGGTVRKKWSFRAVRLEEIPRQFLILDEAKVRAHIKYCESMGVDPEIQGIRFEATMSVGGRA